MVGVDGGGGGTCSVRGVGVDAWHDRGSLEAIDPKTEAPSHKILHITITPKTRTGADEELPTGGPVVVVDRAVEVAVPQGDALQERRLTRACAVAWGR